MGLDAATESLRWGVNDLGGTLMEESISRMAGSYHGVELSPTIWSARPTGPGGPPPSGPRCTRSAAGTSVPRLPRERRGASHRQNGVPAAREDSVERPRSLFAGVEPLEVFVELLARLDTDTSSTEFYDRICEAICRLTTMRRAAIFMADRGRRRVRVVGSYGTSF